LLKTSFASQPELFEEPNESDDSQIDPSDSGQKEIVKKTESIDSFEELDASPNTSYESQSNSYDSHNESYDSMSDTACFRRESVNKFQAKEGRPARSRAPNYVGPENYDRKSLGDSPDQATG